MGTFFLSLNSSFTVLLYLSISFYLAFSGPLCLCSPLSWSICFDLRKICIPVVQYLLFRWEYRRVSEEADLLASRPAPCGWAASSTRRPLSRPHASVLLRYTLRSTQHLQTVHRSGVMYLIERNTEIEIASTSLNCLCNSEASILL